MTAPKQAGNDGLWAKLVEPFPADWIEKLPKQLRKGDEAKARCEDNPAGRTVSADGHFCGGWHARSVHLDYVGHAGITMRLNDVVGPEGWAWEPMALTPEGLPLIGREFWIKLTILGVSKYGVGDDFASSKVAVGDALRNAAMRFGIGTYLWSKSEAAHALATFNDAPPAPSPELAKRDELLAELSEAAKAAGVATADIATEWAASHNGQRIQETTDLAGLELLRDDMLRSTEA